MPPRLEAETCGGSRQETCYGWRKGQASQPGTEVRALAGFGFEQKTLDLLLGGELSLCEADQGGLGALGSESS